MEKSIPERIHYNATKVALDSVIDKGLYKCAYPEQIARDIKELFNVDVKVGSGVLLKPNFYFETAYIKKQIEQLKDVILHGNFVGYSEALATRKERLASLEKELEKFENPKPQNQLTLF
jgi:hypothetical protein